MTDGPTHALIVYGEWLYVKRPHSKQDVSLGQDEWMDQAMLRRLDENCEEIWGLLAAKPVEVSQFSYDGGWLGTIEIAIPAETDHKVINWVGDDQIILIRRSDHCWAELVGDAPHTADDIAWEAHELVLPGPVGSKHIYVPTVQGVPLRFRYPFIVPNGLFKETISWISTQKGETKDGRVAELLFDDIPESANVYVEQTAHFVSQLERIFELLAGEGIFGCDAYGQGWRPGEGWDIAAERVPKELRKKFGWENESDMLLCWCDTMYETEADRDEQASLLYSSNNMHEEWQDRVDIHRTPLSRAVTSTRIYYDGPNPECKRRIAEAIVKHAPAAGLAATWDGDIERAIEVWGGA